MRSAVASQSCEFRATYLRQTFGAKLFNMNRRVLQLDDTLTSISDKLGDMDDRAAEVAKVVRESSLVEGTIEALMRSNACYALFVMRAAENFLAERMRWSEEEDKKDAVRAREDYESNELREEPVMRKEERYRVFAEEDIYGMCSDDLAKQRTGRQNGQDQYQKYLGLLWSLTGQKFRPIAVREDGLGRRRVPFRRASWLPSGFEFLDILAIVYQSMPQNEELRRFITRIIDTEMHRSQARQDAEHADSSKVTMATHPNQLASSSKDRPYSAAGRLLLLKQEAGGVSGNVGSGDLGRGGDVGLGLQGECGGARNYPRRESREREVSDSCERKSSSARSGSRIGWEDRRTIPVVSGRRTYGRLNCRKSQCAMTADRNKRRTKKIQKKTEDHHQQHQQQRRHYKAAEITKKNAIQCVEARRLQMLDFEEDSAAAAAGESPNRNRNNGPDSGCRVRSSSSYTVYVSPPELDADAAFAEQDAQRVAEEGADGERTRKCSGHQHRLSAV